MRPAGPAAPRGSRADAVCPAQIQDLAIRCVQKNIKKNKGVKDWPWWKLFTTVRPLIEVQLTEDQIRGKDVGTAAPGGAGMGQDGSGCALETGRDPQQGGLRDPTEGGLRGHGCPVPPSTNCSLICQAACC